MNIQIATDLILGLVKKALDDDCIEPMNNEETSVSENMTLVGSGSTVLQGVRVGAKATIGSGSVVFSKVDEGITVMGNPAKRVRTFES